VGDELVDSRMRCASCGLGAQSQQQQRAARAARAAERKAGTLAPNRLRSTHKGSGFRAILYLFACPAAPWTLGYPGGVPAASVLPARAM